MMKGAPPPRFSGNVDMWARKLVDYLLSERIERQRPTPVAPQLLYITEAPESAARDGVMLFDNEASVPVVSKGQEYKRIAMEDQTPQLVDVPASSSAEGQPGQIAYDADHFYVCTAVDTWKRVSLTSW